MSFPRTIAVVMAVALPAPGASIPVLLQATLFKKVLHYDRTVEGAMASSPAIVVVHPEGGEDSSVREAFTKNGFTVREARAKDIEGQLAGAVAVYLVQGAQGEAVQALCEKHHVITLAGTSAPAEQGRVSVGLGVKDDGRPQLIVNLRRVKAEGHELSSQLLALAKVIQ